MMTKEQNHISKFISLILRHKPEAINITLNDQGWANVQNLLEGMHQQKKNCTLNDLIVVVDDDSKGRYSFNDDKTMIRANQGHSLDYINLELKPLELREIPNWLYHGTNSRAIKDIMEQGLQPMGRQYVHLSDNIETAKTVGDRRLTKDTVTKIFKISTIEAVNDGIQFYKSENGVYLVETIPPHLLR